MSSGHDSTVALRSPWHLWLPERLYKIDILAWRGEGLTSPAPKGGAIGNKGFLGEGESVFLLRA